MPDLQRLKVQYVIIAHMINSYKKKIKNRWQHITRITANWLPWLVLALTPKQYATLDWDRPGRTGSHANFRRYIYRILFFSIDVIFNLTFSI